MWLFFCYFNGLRHAMIVNTCTKECRERCIAKTHKIQLKGHKRPIKTIWIPSQTGWQRNDIRVRDHKLYKPEELREKQHRTMLICTRYWTERGLKENTLKTFIPESYWKNNTFRHLQAFWILVNTKQDTT